MKPSRDERPHPLRDGLRWLFAPVLAWWSFAAVAPWLLYGAFGLAALHVVLLVISTVSGRRRS